MRAKNEITQDVCAFLRKCLHYRATRINPLSESALCETKNFGVRLLLEALQLMKNCTLPLDNLDQMKLKQSIFLIMAVFDQLAELKSNIVVGEGKLMSDIATALAKILKNRVPTSAAPASPTRLATGNPNELVVEEVHDPLSPPTASPAPRTLTASSTSVREATVIIARSPPGHSHRAHSSHRQHFFDLSPPSSSPVREIIELAERCRLRS